MPKLSENSVDEHVGARMRLRRLVAGMSQTELAERIGVAFQQVQKYENGVNRVSASRLFMAARVLGVPVAYFFEELAGGGKQATQKTAGHNKQQTLIMDFVTSSEGLKLNDAYRRIKDPKVRRRVLDLVRDLAAEDEG